MIVHTRVRIEAVRIHAYTYVCMDVRTYVRMDGWLDGWIVGWMAGWLAGWMDGWMDGRRVRTVCNVCYVIRVCMYECIYVWTAA